MNYLTTNSTIEEIEQAGEYINKAFQSNKEYIAELENVNELQRKLLKVKDQIIENRDNDILNLNQKLEEVMDLAKRAIKAAERNII